MAKIMTAMSGGVDSSVAALLFKQGGHTVSGVTMKLFNNTDIGITDKSKACCTLDDAEDARNVCYKINIPHYVFNFADTFKEQVIERFINGYKKGETPNPCIDCNRYVKFAALLTKIKTLEYDYIATGHYAIVQYNAESGRYLLKKAKDSVKDQSYVLYAATQEQLAATLFPLGMFTKSEIREIARENGLVTAAKSESQDICFVTSDRYSKFIENYTGERMRAGDFIDTHGNVIGKHNGVINFTIGQRKGIGMGFGKPMYVCKKDIEANSVTLGDEKELYSKTLIAGNVNFIAVDKLASPIKAMARTRYNGKEQPATIHQTSENEVFVEFDTPQRAVTSGQAVVFYDGDIVIGGATIK